MKYSIKRKFKPKKKTYKKKYVPRSVVSAGLGFPPRMLMKHKYHYDGTISNVTGSPSTIGIASFYLNGMFQPAVGSTTHQPMYFDQMNAVYTRHTVIGAKVLVKFHNNGTATNTSIIGTFLNNSAPLTLPVTVDGMIENSKGNYRTSLYAGPNSENAKTYSFFPFKWSAKKRFGANVCADPDLEGTQTANPVKTNSITLFMQDVARTTGGSLNFSVDIQYIAVWQGVKDIDTS